MNDKEKVVHEIVDRYKVSINRISMARGVLVLDENVKHLEVPLMNLNIRVIKPPKSDMTDEDIKKSLLLKRILVTNNSQDFISDASVYEYGIIATEGISKDAEFLASMISKAIIKHSLWSKGHGFILILSETGIHRLEDLID